MNDLKVHHFLISLSFSNVESHHLLALSFCSYHQELLSPPLTTLLESKFQGKAFCRSHCFHSPLKSGFPCADPIYPSPSLTILSDWSCQQAQGAAFPDFVTAILLVDKPVLVQKYTILILRSILSSTVYCNL